MSASEGGGGGAPSGAAALSNGPSPSPSVGVSPFPSSARFGSPSGTPFGRGATPGSGSRRGTPAATPGGTPWSIRRSPSDGRARNDLGGSRRPGAQYRRAPSTGERRRRSRSRSRSIGGDGPGDSQPENGEASDLGGALSDSAPSEVAQTFVWGTSVNVDDCTQRFRRFVTNFALEGQPAEQAAFYVAKLRDAKDKQESSFGLDCQHLFAYDPELYRLLVTYPQEIIPIMDVVVNTIYAETLLDPGEESFTSLQVRTYNLKQAKAMRDLNPGDIDQMVAVRGLITRSSAVIPDLKQARFRCASCGHQDATQFVDRGRVAEPAHCPQCQAAGTMGLVHNLCVFANKQQLRMQENPDAIPDGETPHTVSLCVFDELVDCAKPGDRVEVTGVFRAVAMRVAPNQRTLRSVYKTYIDVIHIRKDTSSRLRNETGDEAAAAVDGDAPPAPPQSATADPEAGFTQEREAQIQALGAQPDVYERLVASLAPSIWELEDVKKGILCQLFGGVVKRFQGASLGKGFRGDLNVLLVGDPGTSKSQLLTYVHKIAPRGLYTSGRGSSAVGLTAYVTKDPETREAVLESGALVLSDRGVCCIDEFDKMSEGARSTLHEVMEQQTVSVAKAGIIATLNARTSVLASANPVGSRYNPRMSVIDNIQLPPSLLSRFDLIYLVLDKPDPQTDRRLARHLVALHYQVAPQQSAAAVDMALLTDYISYARSHCHPALTDEAAEMLVNGYVDMRRLGGGRTGAQKVITATPRQLESLIRLSEALARMRLSAEVTAADCEEAMRLMKVAMQQAAMDPNTGTIDMDRIYTGVSASDRRQRRQVAEAVQEFLKGQPGGSARLGELLAHLKEQASGMGVTMQDVRDGVLVLQQDSAAVLQGDSVRLRA